MKKFKEKEKDNKQLNLAAFVEGNSQDCNQEFYYLFVVVFVHQEQQSSKSFHYYKQQILKLNNIEKKDFQHHFKDPLVCNLGQKQLLYLLKLLDLHHQSKAKTQCNFN